MNECDNFEHFKADRCLRAVQTAFTNLGGEIRWRCEVNSIETNGKTKRGCNGAIALESMSVHND